MTTLRALDAAGPGRSFRAIALGGCAGVLVALPFLLSGFRTFQLTLAIAYALACLGLTVLIGYSGQVSLAQGAFFGVGAYSAAILIDRGEVPILLTLPAAAAICFVAGFLFGIPALRLGVLQLALVTFGLSVVLPRLLLKLDWLTGGSKGILIEPPAPPSWLGLSADRYRYLLALLVAALVFFAGSRLMRGRVGRSLLAIHDHQVAAESFGINVTWAKSLAFAYGSAFAGVGGALFAWMTGFVAAESFPPLLSISILAGAVIGGITAVVGAAIGGLFIQFVPAWASDVNPALSGLIYGGALALVLVLLPGGAAGLLTGSGRRLARGILHLRAMRSLPRPGGARTTGQR
ncbi:MAG: branched-chain amino acid ABC transporter permease [Thermoleophilia bacterium]|nr:branched-chain amino acid ABC transporter permease [Thermoleophilia bacterium]